MAFRRIRDSITAGRALSIAGLIGCLFINTSAHAIPVGDFSWNEYSLQECDTTGLLCGAYFSVGNFSDDPDFSLGLLGDSFLDVLVDLQTGGAPQSLALGNIDPGNSSQSIDNLFDLTITSAVLRLTFGAPALPGFLQLLDQDGNIVGALTGPGSLLIDYVADIVIPPVTPVPEPSVLLLLASGLLGAALGRKRKDQSQGARA